MKHNSYLAAAATAAFLLLCCMAARAESLRDVLLEKGVITQEEAARIAEPVPVQLTYDKGLRLDVPDKGIGLSLFNIVQPRYQFSDNDSDSGSEDTSGVQLRRARIYLAGYSLNRDLTFNMMTDLVGNSREGESAAPDLQDLFVSYYPIKSWELRLGQYLVPFIRESTLAYTHQFPDFDVATQNFAFFRQPGAGTWYRSPDGKFAIGLSGYNGTSSGEGRDRAAVDTKHLGVANVRWSPLARIDPLEDGDLGNTAEPAVSIGAAYVYGEAEIEREEDRLDSDISSYNADLNFKYRGFSWQSEFIASDNSGEAGDSSPLGLYTQAGYFVVPQTFELAGRYAMVDCSDSAASQCRATTDRIDEYAVAGNYYFTKSYAYRLQLSWTARRDKQLDGLTDLNSQRVVLQLGVAM